MINPSSQFALLYDWYHFFGSVEVQLLLEGYQLSTLLVDSTKTKQ